MTQSLRFAALGTGFWSRFQIAGWHELPGVKCVALYNRTRANALPVAQAFGIAAAHVYDRIEQLLDNEELDFIDIISSPQTHRQFTELSAQYGCPVISQKPMAPDLESAQAMLDACTKSGVQLFVHENWRFQSPMRRLKQLLDSDVIGTVFRGTINYLTAFPVYENQPFLKDADQFILSDIGSHVLDTARYLFGEASSLYCRARNVNPVVRAEDVATVVMDMGGNIVTVNMSYFTRIENDRFPQTRLFIEGDCGTLELKHDYEIRVTTNAGTACECAAPHHYPWADPQYDIVHASIVDCNRSILSAIKGEGSAETTGADNLKTMRLVHGAYASASTGAVITL